MPEPTNLSPARHEGADVGLRSMAIGGALLLLTLAALIVVPGLLFPRSMQDRPAPPARQPDPQLQSDPDTDMALLRAEQRRWLDGTGWTDRPHGRVHVPIADAMARLARDGIAGWPSR